MLSQGQHTHLPITGPAAVEPQPLASQLAVQRVGRYPPGRDKLSSVGAKRGRMQQAFPRTASAHAPGSLLLHPQLVLEISLPSCLRHTASRTPCKSIPGLLSAKVSRLVKLATGSCHHACCAQSSSSSRACHLLPEGASQAPLLWPNGAPAGIVRVQSPLSSPFLHFPATSFSSCLSSTDPQIRGCSQLGWALSAAECCLCCVGGWQ